MHKRMIAALLCLLLVTAAAIPAAAAQDGTVLKIESVADFLKFAENCRLDSYSRNLQVMLTADLDLEGTDFQGIPIFCGSFDGNGHRITGLQITAEGSVQGLFRYLTETAVVCGLQVYGSVQPEGSRGSVGGIAGSNAGRIENCGFTGTVSGADRVGGIAGVNTVTGAIVSCSTLGSIQGDHFVGGVAGENAGVIRSCTNSAAINVTAQQNSVAVSDITLDTLTGSESANTVTDIGGIAGTSSGVIRSCLNRGDVGYRHMGYNIGGIAGSQSGYVTGCKNIGAISGRKEVGGIVGQMEPVITLIYDEDTLQTLREQLDTLSRLTDQATQDARNSASGVTSQLEALQSQTETAKAALEQMMPEVDVSQIGTPEVETPQLEVPEIESPEDIEFPEVELPEDIVTVPDRDTLTAAQNSLNSSLSAMPGTISGIAASAQNSASQLSQDVQAISDQIDLMNETISNASENLGGSASDISDADTEADITGKVADCVNNGAVLADMNAGGIAGAMALENDLDPESDVQISGESTLNFEGEFRCVIRDCTNTGSVTATKRYVGGVVGWQSMGLVRQCVNTGTLDAAQAGYVGGIAGSSCGYLRSCSAKCRLSGGTYTGGIAGSGSVVSGCYSMVHVEQAGENLGAVLGGREDSDDSQPVAANFYLCLDTDLGGIDGISYEGQAQGLSKAEFLALEDLPDLFRTATVTFLAENGSQKTVRVALGDCLDEADIPQLEQKVGYEARWEGLEALSGGVRFDTVLQAGYTSLQSVIESEAVRETGLPVLLAEGSFGAEAVLTVQESETRPQLQPEQTLLECWSFAVSDGQVQRLRFLPEASDGTLQILLQDADGVWQEVQVMQDGSYLVFSPDAGTLQFALVRTERSIPGWLIAAAALGIAVIAGGILLGCRLGKKKKKA